MRDYKKLFGEAVESASISETRDYRNIEKRNLSNWVVDEHNVKLTYAISSVRQELKEIRTELNKIKAKLKLEYNLALATYQKKCERKVYETPKSFDPFVVWIQNSGDSEVDNLAKILATLESKNEFMTAELKQLKKAYSLESQLFTPSSKNFWTGTPYEGLEGYLIYLLLFRKSYNYRLFIETYERPVDELISEVTLALLKVDKVEMAKSLSNELEIKRLISNTTRVTLERFAREVSTDITISEWAIRNERDKERMERKAFQQLRKVRQLATAGKVQRFLSEHQARTAQKKAVKIVNQKNPREIEVKNTRVASAYTYYCKNLKPLLEVRAGLLEGTQRPIVFPRMEAVVRELAPTTYERYFNRRSVSEICKLLKLKKTSVYERLKNEKVLLIEHFKYEKS